MPGSLFQRGHHVQHTSFTWRAIFGLFRCIRIAAVTLAHAITPQTYIKQVTWCWILGATMCFTLGNTFWLRPLCSRLTSKSSAGSSIAEIVSAFPTCGGLYTASAQLCPRERRPIVGWVVGWLNILGQVAGVSSTEFGLASMMLAAASIAKVMRGIHSPIARIFTLYIIGWRVPHYNW